MKIPKPGLFLLLVLSVLASGCFVLKPKEDSDKSKAAFAGKNAAFIKEMAEYAVLFCRANNINSFSTEQVDNKEIRQKLARLGLTITVIYSDNVVADDSTVTFKYITLLHGVQEYVYDFSTIPKNIGNQRQPGETIRIQAAERVYYLRRPFPMM